jgi:hypothetical protein
MTTIPQVADAMQTILTDQADRAGWQTRFVQRVDAKLTGSIFTQTLVFGLGADPQASLGALSQTTAALGVTVSAEALHQRFDRTAASCLEQVLCAAVRQIVATDPIVLPILDRFPQVVVQDSTTISLPEALATVWQGCGNGMEHAGNAALKLHLALDLRTGRLRGPSLHPGRESDTAATLEHDLPAGAVRLVDLGFWDLALLAHLRQRGVYWFSRAQAMTALQTADGRWWQLLELLETHTDATLDLAVRLGREDQVAARLIAVRAPQEVVDQRRRRLRQEAKEKGQTVSALRLALAAWSVFVTTIPPALLRVEEALILGRARWQIELLIKLWKSHGQIDLVREVQPWRVLCELYGRLLNQIVQHWLLLISCWDEVARSLVKAAQTIRMHWLALAMAMPRHERLVEAITTLARCIRAGCRMNRRKKHPNTYQRFLVATESCVM